NAATPPSSSRATPNPRGDKTGAGTGAARHWAVSTLLPESRSPGVSAVAWLSRMTEPGVTVAFTVIVMAGSPGLSTPLKVHFSSLTVDAAQFQPTAGVTTIDGRMRVIVAGIGSSTTIGPEVGMFPSLVIEILNCVVPPG